MSWIPDINIVHHEYTRPKDCDLWKPNVNNMYQ